jgi:hypothetical protein
MATRLSASLATFNDSSQQAVSTNSYALGVGQSWTNVTSSRALATTYTNSTGRPIMVSITNYFSTSNALVLNVDSFGVTAQFSSAFNTGGGGTVGSPNFCVVIPIGATYIVPNTFWPFEYWWELR